MAGGFPISPHDLTEPEGRVKSRRVCRILQPILFDWWITMTAALLLANAAAWTVLALAMIMVRARNP